jgi:uncharacterized protein YndB with AHSA1/START domain
MEPSSRTEITVQTTVSASRQKVWTLWTTPEHIVNWNTASDDWHTPRAENDLRVGGKFLSRMEAKDGSFGFDFVGVYDDVIPLEYIAYTMEDGRKARITYTDNGNATDIAVVFDAENENPVEMQRGGWQAIMDNFKKYAESN